MGHKGNLKTSRPVKYQPRTGNNNNLHTTSRNNYSNSTFCNNCGEFGHIKYNCKFDKVNRLQCEYCGKLGHYSTICKSRILNENINCEICGRPGHVQQTCFHRKDINNNNITTRII